MKTIGFFGVLSKVKGPCHRFTRFHGINQIENSVTFAVTIVINRSRDLIGTLGIAEFGPKQGQVFQTNVMSLC